MPENGAAVKFVSDGDVAASSRNGPTDVVPSTSVDAVAVSYTHLTLPTNREV